MNTPLGSMLGTGSEVQCKVIAADISVHWFPRGAVPGDRCICGATVKAAHDDGADDA